MISPGSVPLARRNWHAADVSVMQRVLVLGCSGVGKSTFSRRLADIIGLPRIELDQLFWRPGWQPTPREQWLAAVADLCAAPRWIMDGNFHSSMHIRMAHADTVFWLDYPRHVCLRRVIMRWIANYGRVRDGMAQGCPEKIDLEFLRYVWNFNAKHRPRILSHLETHASHLRLHRFASGKETETLLSHLRVKRAQI